MHDFFNEIIIKYHFNHLAMIETTSIAELGREERADNESRIDSIA